MPPSSADEAILGRRTRSAQPERATVLDATVPWLSTIGTAEMAMPQWSRGRTSRFDAVQPILDHLRRRCHRGIEPSTDGTEAALAGLLGRVVPLTLLVAGVAQGLTGEPLGALQPPSPRSHGLA